MTGKDGEPIEIAAEARLRLDRELDLIATRLASETGDGPSPNRLTNLPITAAPAALLIE
jgi:hypothetical protein